MDDLQHVNVVGEVSPQELVKQCRAGFDMLAKSLKKKRPVAQVSALNLMLEAARQAHEVITKESSKVNAHNVKLKAWVAANKQKTGSH